MKIAIKGLIGSGKTTTSKYLEENYNAYHYNCDKRVKSIYASDVEVIKRVTSEIMESPNDYIDTKKLGQIVFNDVVKLKALEAIIYPYIREEINCVCKEHAIVLLDCQQIDKIDIEPDYVFSLSISDEEITKRVSIRDSRDPKQTQSIIDIQKKQEIANADYVIVNEGNLDQLYARLDQIMKEINE